MTFGGAGSGFSNPPVGNQGIIQRAAFESDDYVPGVSGWCIYRNGNVEFNSGTFRGTVNGGAFQGTNFEISPAGMFFYSGIPALGNLVYSVAPVGGTDPYGNVYQSIAVVGTTGSFQIQLTSNSGSGLMYFKIPGYTPGKIQGGVAGSFADLVLAGPANTAVNFTDNVYIELNSSDGASSSANMSLVYTDASNTGHNSLVIDYTGVNIPAGQITAVHPGTGTSALNPAVSEQWQPDPTYLNGWSILAAGSDLYYRVTADGYIRFTGRLLVPSSPSNPSKICTFPAGYRPLYRTETVILHTHSNATPYPGAALTATIGTNGDFQVYGALTAGYALEIQCEIPLNA